jgi:plasmid stabilization system protein ParE
VNYRVVFTPEAEQQLLALYRHIAQAASPAVAARYTDAVVRCCETLAIFPQRGTPRDDVRPGLRTTHYKGRTVLAYTVVGDQVAVLGVFYGGQDHEARLRQDDLA